MIALDFVYILRFIFMNITTLYLFPSSTVGIYLFIYLFISINRMKGNKMPNEAVDIIKNLFIKLLISLGKIL